jgi:hypothetical protein
MDVLNQLSTVYNNWLDEQKIEDRASADELYFGHPNLNDKQKNWLSNFIVAWEQGEDFQSYVDKILPNKQ